VDICAPLLINARLNGIRGAIHRDGRDLGWAQFADQVARFASVLRDLGVREGDRVAILADNCDLFMAAFFAVPWVGAILVPLNTRLNPAELTDLISLSSPVLLLHDGTHGALAAAALGEAEQSSPATMAMRDGPESLLARIAAITRNCCRAPSAGALDQVGANAFQLSTIPSAQQRRAIELIETITP